MAGIELEKRIDDSAEAEGRAIARHNLLRIRPKIRQQKTRLASAAKKLVEVKL